MQIRFEGQTVLVAGAARGIGRAIAKAFAADGAKVIAGDILLKEVKAIAGRGKGGGSITAVQLDTTSPASLRKCVAQAAKKQGAISGLVYVAGGVLGQVPQPMETVSPENFSAIVDVNLKGAFLAAQAVVPGMKKAGRGRIVIISSRAGLATSRTGIQSYAAAKHAQVGLVKQLAQELGPFGITVNAIAPGFMMTNPDTEKQWLRMPANERAQFTDTIAVRRMGRPEDIADAALFLASDRASFITGQTLVVTGSPLA
jgi:3-oxoacyl-[acyl-carrier protein] reductase